MNPINKALNRILFQCDMILLGKIVTAIILNRRVFINYFLCLFIQGCSNLKVDDSSKLPVKVKPDFSAFTDVNLIKVAE
jgi:hypothetical protein